MVAFPEDVQPDLTKPQFEMVLSPDGRLLLYVSSAGGTSRLCLRDLDRLETRAIPETEGASAPFFSPDGRWVGFFADGKLKKLYLEGGKPIPLAEAEWFIGGAWAPDDTIFYCPAWVGGLWKVSADGGEPVEVTKPRSEKGEIAHRSPEILPDGKGVLFTIWSSTINDAQVAVLSRATGEWKALITGGFDARYSPTKHLLYAQSGTLVAVPFDADRLEVGSPDVPVLEDLSIDPTTGLASYALSSSGLLVYAPGSAWQPRRKLVWVDRRGETEVLPLPPGAYEDPALSPDGGRLAYCLRDRDGGDIWIYEFASGRARQITFESYNFGPIWSPDGKHLTFTSGRLGLYSVFRMPVDRSEAAEPFLAGPIDQMARSQSADGEILLVEVLHPQTGFDIGYISLRGGKSLEYILNQSCEETQAVLHPDGEWIAYASNQTGRAEVSVRPFPGPGGEIPISAEGGRYPLWSPDGRELFYRSGGKMMAVEVQTEPRFRAGRPEMLFEGDYLLELVQGTVYDIAPDGRFLMIEKDPDEGKTDLVMVFNWFPELNRLCPAGK
jgi:serine/threonine-protein kinase